MVRTRQGSSPPSPYAARSARVNAAPLFSVGSSRICVPRIGSMAGISPAGPRPAGDGVLSSPPGAWALPSLAAGLSPASPVVPLSSEFIVASQANALNIGLAAARARGSLVPADWDFGPAGGLDVGLSPGGRGPIAIIRECPPPWARASQPLFTDLKQRANLSLVQGSGLRQPEHRASGPARSGMLGAI